MHQLSRGLIEGDTVRIGEDEKTAVLQKAEWNVLVSLIQVRAAWRARGRGVASVMAASRSDATQEQGNGRRSPTQPP